METEGKAKSSRKKSASAATGSNGSDQRPVKRLSEKRQARELETEKKLVSELDQLRGFVQQIATRYKERLESEIVQIRGTVESTRGCLDRLYSVSMMLQALRGLEIKPDKGRLKDLKRIDAIMSILNRLAQKIQ